MELRVTEESAAASGKENLASTAMTGKALFMSSQVLCPVSTSSAFAIGDQSEIRAYKLGKQKCSYNQVELVVQDMNGKYPELQVSEAIETAIGAEVDDLLKESCLKFNVRFVNNERMHLYIYVVYASPHCSMSRGESKQAARYYWVPVTRSKCRKGCKGPVIRGLQRFGRMSRRVGNMNSLQGFAEQGRQEHIVNAVQNSGNGNNSFSVGDSWKEPRHLYIAIDEASTHVCPRPQTSKFRLLVAAYDDQNQLVGSAVSSCIRVLANNDAPLGAASFKLLCHIKGMKKSANWLPIMTWPACSGVSQDKQYGRFPLQEMSQIKFNPSSEVTRESNIGTVNVLWSKVQEISPVVDEQLIAAENPSSSCCSDEAIVNEDNSSLDNLCQRVFDACSCKQQGVIALRKFATILGASRHLLMDIFSVLSIIKVVEEQGKEKYIWLGSNRIEDALQELLVNQNQSNLSTQKNCKAGLHKDCEILSLSELGTRFCLLFLSNKYADIRWEFAVDALLSKIKGSAREGIRTTLWKISVILSALHLIVSKRGPVFKWNGSEGVAAHLNSLAHSRLVQRCPEASYCPKKRKKIDLEDVDGDSFADDRDELSSFCNQVQICRSPDKKRSRLSLTLPGSACDSDVERVSQSSSAMKCISIDSTNTEYKYGLEELQNRRKNTSHPSSTEFGCRKCMKCLQNSLGMLCSEDEDDHNGKNRTFAALYQVSTSCTNNVAHLCRLSSPEKQKLCFTCCQPEAACYLNCKMVNEKGSQEGRSSNCSIPLLHCLVSKVDGSPTITDDPAEHALENVNWHFDPLASLSSIYTPQQVITLQQCNPGFLINFVRYYRQLYHKYGCKSDALVHLPFAIRPCYSSFCLVKNLAAKVTSFTTNHSGPNGMLQRNSNLAPPEKFP